MEFRMTTDLSVMNPSELVFNYEEIESYLIQCTERYRNLLVEEDDLANAKSDRANLRKMATALNDQKISVKKAFMKPYDEFESKIKRLIALCDEPAKNIDEQIKAFEAAAKAKKKAELEQHFIQNIGEAAEYVSFDDVFDPKWLNATVAVETAKETIAETCVRYIEDIGVLNGLCEEADTSTAYALKRAYKATRSLSNVMRTKSEIDRELKLQEERRANEEARKQREAELAEKDDALVSHVQEFAHAQSGTLHTDETSENNTQEEMIEVEFKVKCTRSQLAALKSFLVNNGIRYGKV